MAWIESHQELAQHPKTKRLMRLLGLSQYEALGALHMLWWWAMEYAQEGDLSEYSDDDIADAISWPKDAGELVRALIESKFIDDDRRLHDWHAYAGKLIERRRIDAERKRRSIGTPPDVRRTIKGSEPESGSNPNRTQTLPDRTPIRGPGGAGGESPPDDAASAAAPPPKPPTTGRVKPAPKPTPRRDRFAETLDAIKALDREVVIGGDRSRNAKAVNESMADPALIAEAYVALMHGEWQDGHVAKQGSLHAVVDNVGGYVNSKRRPPNGTAGHHANGVQSDARAEHLRMASLIVAKTQRDYGLAPREGNDATN